MSPDAFLQMGLQLAFYRQVLTFLSFQNYWMQGPVWINVINLWQHDKRIQSFVWLNLNLQHGELCGIAQESVHTRHFLHGCGESVRTVTSDSVAFVKVRSLENSNSKLFHFCVFQTFCLLQAMEHLDTASAETKLHLLRRACISHVEKVKVVTFWNLVSNSLVCEITIYCYPNEWYISFLEIPLLS